MSTSAGGQRLPQPGGRNSDRLSESVGINGFSHISLQIPNIRHLLLFKPILWFGFWLCCCFRTMMMTATSHWTCPGRIPAASDSPTCSWRPSWFLSGSPSLTPGPRRVKHFVKQVFYHLILFEYVFFIGTLGLKAPKIRSPQYVLYWPTKWKGWCRILPE